MEKTKEDPRQIERTTILLTARDQDLLLNFCKAKNISKSYLVRKLILDFLEKNKPEVTQT